jgi:hypothetical protein
MTGLYLVPSDVDVVTSRELEDSPLVVVDTPLNVVD